MRIGRGTSDLCPDPGHQRLDVDSWTVSLESVSRGVKGEVESIQVV